MVDQYAREQVLSHGCVCKNWSYERTVGIGCERLPPSGTCKWSTSQDLSEARFRLYQRRFCNESSIFQSVNAMHCYADITPESCQFSNVFEQSPQNKALICKMSRMEADYSKISSTFQDFLRLFCRLSVMLIILMPRSPHSQGF